MGYDRVLFLDPEKVYGEGDFLVSPTLGLEYAAAAARNAGADVRLVDLSCEPLDLTELSRFAPQLVGIDCFSYQHDQVEWLARQMKTLPGAPRVVVGNVHATIAPDLVARMPAVDFIVRGEGEPTVAELVSGVPTGKIAGLSFRRDSDWVHGPDRPRTLNLDSLPLPARDLRRHPGKYRYLGLPFEPLMASRGCLYRCSFCSAHLLYDGQRSAFSPQRVVEEMKMLARRATKPRILLFWDLDFLSDSGWLEQFIEVARGSGPLLPFSAMARADSVLACSHLLPALRKLGLLSVTLGLETPDDERLAALNKEATADVGGRAVGALHRAGILAFSFMMVGFPDDDQRTFLRTLKYADRADVDFLIFLHATPLPRTGFFQQMHSAGLIESYVLEDYNLSETPVLKLNRLSHARLKLLMQMGTAAVALSPRRLARLVRYFARLRPGPLNAPGFMRSMLAYTANLSREEGWRYWRGVSREGAFRINGGR